MRRKIYGIMIVLSVALIVSGCASPTAETIDVKTDSIPSIYKIVGERKIVGTESNASTNARTTIITYDRYALSEADLIAYTSSLEDDYGFTVTTHTTQTGNLSWRLSKESNTPGNHVIVSIMFASDGRTVISYASVKYFS